MPGQGALMAAANVALEKENHTLRWENGVCSGLSTLFLWYMAQNDLAGFKRRQRQLHQADNSPEKVQTKLSIVSTVQSVQAPESSGFYLGQDDTAELLQSLDHTRVLSKNHKDPGYDPEKERSRYRELYRIGFIFNRQQLISVIQEVIQKHPHQLVKIGANNHAGAIYYDGKKYYCYEPNKNDESVEKLNIMEFDTEEDLVTEMVEHGFFHAFNGGSAAHFNNQNRQFTVSFAVFENPNETDQEQYPDPVDLLETVGALNDFPKTKVVEYGVEYDPIDLLLRRTNVPPALLQKILSKQSINSSVTDFSWVKLMALGAYTSPDCYGMLLGQMSNALFNDNDAAAQLKEVQIQAVGLCIAANNFFSLKKIIQFYRDESNFQLFYDFLKTAVEIGNVDAVKVIIDEITDDNQQAILSDDQIVELIELAVAKRHFGVVKQLRAKWTGAAVSSYVTAVMALLADEGSINDCSAADIAAALSIVIHIVSESVLIDLYNGKIVKDNFKDENNNSLLHIAAMHGHSQLVNKLLKKDELEAQLEQTNKEGMTPLMLALAGHHVAVAESLLANMKVANTDFRQAETNKHTLHLACELKVDYPPEAAAVATTTTTTTTNASATATSRRSQRAKALRSDVLAKYADKMTAATDSRKDAEENTPLHIAAKRGDFDLVEQLVKEQGCSLFAKNKDGDTPFHVATRVGVVDVVRYMLVQEESLRSSEQNSLSQTANSAGQLPIHVASAMGSVELIEILYPQVGVNALTKNKGTKSLPLNFAIQHDSHEAVAKLIELGDSVDGHPQGDPVPPLIHALMKNSNKLIGLLIDRGANVNCVIHPEHDGRALYAAVKSGNKRLVQALVDNGVVPANGHGKKALQLAFKKERYDLAAILLTCPGIEVGAFLHIAIRLGNFQAVKVLVDSGRCDAAQKNAAGDNVLHAICKYPNYAIFQYIKEHLDLSNALQDVNADGKRPLQIADVKKNQGSAQEQAEAKRIYDGLSDDSAGLTVRRVDGGSRSYSNPEGRLTALHIAVLNNDGSQVSLLLQRDADVNAQDRNGKTAKDLADENGFKRVSQMLSPVIVADSGASAAGPASDAAVDADTAAADAPVVGDEAVNRVDADDEGAGASDASEVAGSVDHTKEIIKLIQNKAFWRTKAHGKLGVPDGIAKMQKLCVGVNLPEFSELKEIALEHKCSRNLFYLFTSVNTQDPVTADFYQAVVNSISYDDLYERLLRDLKDIASAEPCANSVSDERQPLLAGSINDPAAAVHVKFLARL